jgi:hypothetical protein
MEKECMSKLAILFVAAICVVNPLRAEKVHVFIVAGQSNAQGWQGDAAFYPKDSTQADKNIRFYWQTPGYSSSAGKWTTLRAQGGRFRNGHFGPEVTFARSLKSKGYNPAIFKYTLGSTSLANNWKRPGHDGMYDQMVKELAHALSLLAKDGHEVGVRGFVWIQGESDAQTAAMAGAYEGALKSLIVDLRKNVTKTAKLPTILGVDEQHPWVKKNGAVVHAQKMLAEADPQITFTTMMGLEKADGTHLTPGGLEKHGEVIFNAYMNMTKDQSRLVH